MSATQPLTRQLSRRLVVETLLHRAPISRAALAKETGLSKQTISEVVDLLERHGWAHATGRTSGSIGRTAVNYAIRHDAAFVFGVDLGGTKIAAALADMTCNVVGELTEPTNPTGGMAVVEQLRSILSRLAAQAGVSIASIQLAVIGSPGVLDPRAGSVAFAPNIQGFGLFDVRSALRETFGCEVELENDVNLAVLGERWRGCAAGLTDVAFLALGTGIGMGLVSGGNLMRGSRGAAGEIAYLPLGEDPGTPTARLQGALEQTIGAAGIVHRYTARGGTAGLAVRDIFDRMNAGEAAAVLALDETAALVAQAILAVASVVDPEIVVLGGSIGSRPEMVELVRRHHVEIAPADLPIVASELGIRAGLVGALAVGLNRMHNTLFGVQDLTGEVSLPGPKFVAPRASLPADVAS